MADLSQLKLLVNLARADGEIVQEEKAYLINIGKANGVEPLEIEVMLKNDHSETLPANITEEERFNLLFKLVQLMKADGKLFTEEIRYCAKIASRLGYREEVLFELMLKIESGNMDIADITKLREDSRKFLE